eukprot:CAMPEP_0115026368 /NCGR_PEP_ID=MMETSP0216-20121206/34696_1 /TAXON_ID=223996 /ORGANISM="Protocruzia adherens, Strain Boccale" /LENGTH=354 /DNA_ID=CAMNT_0002401413 /DNA_START=79 /DNA_END=1143 /DNA_ORIENTATION=+
MACTVHASIQVIKNNPNRDRMILLGNSGMRKESPLGFDHISSLELVQFLDHEMTPNMELIRNYGQNQLIQNYSTSTILSKVKRAFVVKTEGYFPINDLETQPIAEFELFEPNTSTCVDTATCFADGVKTQWQTLSDIDIDACVQNYFDGSQTMSDIKDVHFLTNVCGAMSFTLDNQKKGVFAWDLTSDEVDASVRLPIIAKCVSNLEKVFSEAGKYHGFVFASHSKTLIHSDDFNFKVLEAIEGVLSHSLHEDNVHIETASTCSEECQNSINDLFKNDSLYRMRQLYSDNAEDGEEYGNNGEESNTVERMIMGWTGFLLGLIAFLVLGGILLSDQSKDTLLYSKFLTSSEQGPR